MAHDPDSSVYRPDVVFVRAEAAKSIGNKITEPPALVVEFVSPSTRSLDCVIKKQDYEKAAIEEYWMIDPGKDEMTFFGLREGVYMELPNDGQRFNSHTIEGFSLDLARIRQGWQQ
jgi:Uma2 family endonuclease